MHDLPTDWSALCTIIFLLGMRHGFDADHLATIDRLTRLNSRRQRALFALASPWIDHWSEGNELVFGSVGAT